MEIFRKSLKLKNSHKVRLSYEAEIFRTQFSHRNKGKNLKKI